MAKVLSLRRVGTDHGARWAVGAVLLLLASVWSGVVPGSAAVVDPCSNYTVTFLGATFDGTNTTFSYRV